MSTSIGTRAVPTLAVIATATMSSGCEAIGAIFKAGLWTGIIGVVAVILVVMFVATKLGRS